MLAGAEGVGEGAEVDELRDLRLADDELRAALDGAILVGEAAGQRVVAVVAPVDDLDQFAADEVAQSHARLQTGQAFGPGGFCHTGRPPVHARIGIPRLAGVAQLVEQLIRNQQVTRSSRVAGSNDSLPHDVGTRTIGVAA